VIVVDHFSNELTLFKHSVSGLEDESADLDRIEQIIFSNRFATFKFAVTNGEQSNFTDGEFLKVMSFRLFYREGLHQVLREMSSTFTEH
jgi:anthranilate synthase component I